MRARGCLGSSLGIRLYYELIPGTKFSSFLTVMIKSNPNIFYILNQ